MTIKYLVLQFFHSFAVGVNSNDSLSSLLTIPLLYSRQSRQMIA